MNLYCAAFASLALSFGSSCLASTCQIPEQPFGTDLFVAAPEMLQPVASSGCLSASQVIAALVPAKAVAVPASVSAADGYVPKTKYDNTPWRFDMNQNGKRMTAEQFDAWMKAKGIRVATGKAATIPVEGQAVQ